MEPDSHRSRRHLRDREFADFLQCKQLGSGGFDRDERDYTTLGALKTATGRLSAASSENFWFSLSRISRIDLKGVKKKPAITTKDEAIHEKSMETNFFEV